MCGSPKGGAHAPCAPMLDPPMELCVCKCQEGKKNSEIMCIQMPRGEKKKKNSVIPPGIEPGTLSVLDSRDNRYTTESPYWLCSKQACFIRYPLYADGKGSW